MKQVYPLALGAFGVVALISGCGAATPAASTSAAGKISINLQNLAINTGTASLLDLSNLFQPDRTGEHAYLGNYSTATQLTALKYIFQQISLCQTTDATSAFGFNTEGGCTTLYSNSTAPPAIGASVAQILAGYNLTTDQFDLMSKTDIARLNAKSAAATAGTYNYVLVNWAAAIGVQGSVTAGGTTLYTRAQTSITSNVSTTPSMTAVTTPELTYVQSANGGTIFKFQASQTVSATTNYLLDIIFNPTGVLNGCKGGTSGNITDGTNGITMPMLPVSAVLRTSTDTLMRESYPITTGVSGVNYQVDLYYVKSDATKSVIGAQITGLITTTDSTCYAPDNRVFTVSTAANKSLTLTSDSAGVQILISGLVRSATGVGSTITFGSGFYGLPSGVTTGTEGTMTSTSYN